MLLQGCSSCQTASDAFLKPPSTSSCTQGTCCPLSCSPSTGIRRASAVSLQFAACFASCLSRQGVEGWLFSCSAYARPLCTKNPLFCAKPGPWPGPSMSCDYATYVGGPRTDSWVLKQASRLRVEARLTPTDLSSDTARRQRERERERERGERDSLRPYSQQRPTRTNLF